MEIHVLDFIMWFVMIGIYWGVLGWLSEGEFTEELGGLVGCLGIIIITIIYIVLFVFMGWNWSDIFHGANPQDWIHFKL